MMSIWVPIGIVAAVVVLGAAALLIVGGLVFKALRSDRQKQG